MEVVENNKINEAQAAVEVAAPAAAATTNAPVAADTSNAPAAETPWLFRCFAYCNKILMADKEFFWHQYEIISTNVIGMFENDLICGSVVSFPRPSANKFDYTV